MIQAQVSTAHCPLVTGRDSQQLKSPPWHLLSCHHTDRLRYPLGLPHPRHFGYDLRGRHIVKAVILSDYTVHAKGPPPLRYFTLLCARPVGPKRAGSLLDSLLVTLFKWGTPKSNSASDDGRPLPPVSGRFGLPDTGSAILPLL